MGATIQNSLLKGFFLLVIFVCHNSQAQFHHGLELGMNMTNADFMIGESAEPSNSFGFLIGYVAERDFSDNLYIRFGANYNRREFKAISRRGINTSNETWGIDVIEVPINLGYYLNWNNRNYQFFIDAGMNLGYNSRAFTKTEDETIRLDIRGDSDIATITVFCIGNQQTFSHYDKVRNSTSYPIFVWAVADKQIATVPVGFRSDFTTIEEYRVVG